MPNRVHPNQWITVVSGLPRSGTSLMMQMLESGGMEVVVDNLRNPDEDNPKGYYEFEPVKEIKNNSSWIQSTHGKVFKMVSALLHTLPGDKDYKIIFMKRDMAEILASQRIMLQRSRGGVAGPSDEEMKRLFEKHLAATEGWLRTQGNMDVLYVNYNSVIREPRENARKINHFLGMRLNVDALINAVDEALYRNRCSV